ITPVRITAGFVDPERLARLCLETDALRPEVNDAVVAGIGRRAEPAAGNAPVAGRIAAVVGPAERVVGRAAEGEVAVLSAGKCTRSDKKIHLLLSFSVIWRTFRLRTACISWQHNF